MASAGVPRSAGCIGGHVAWSKDPSSYRAAARRQVGRKASLRGIAGPVRIQRRRDVGLRQSGEESLKGRERARRGRTDLLYAATSAAVTALPAAK